MKDRVSSRLVRHSFLLSNPSPPTSHSSPLHQQTAFAPHHTDIAFFRKHHPKCQKTYPNPSPSTATHAAAKQQKNAPSHPKANNPPTSKPSSPTQTNPSTSPLPQSLLLHFHQKSSPTSKAPVLVREVENSTCIKPADDASMKG